MRRCEVVLMDQGNFLCFLVPYPQGLYNRRQNWQGQHNRIIVMVEYSVEYSVLPIPKSYPLAAFKSLNRTIFNNHQMIYITILFYHLGNQVVVNERGILVIKC